MSRLTLIAGGGPGHAPTGEVTGPGGGDARGFGGADGYDGVDGYDGAGGFDGTGGFDGAGADGRAGGLGGERGLGAAGGEVRGRRDSGPGSAHRPTGDRRSPVLPSAAGHLRLTARGRVLVVALAVVVGATLGFVAGRADAAAEPVPAVEVVVEPGDTLWSLAGRVAAPDEDLRDVVIEIRRLNRMLTSSLVAGQVLLLPGDRDDAGPRQAAE